MVALSARNQPERSPEPENSRKVRNGPLLSVPAAVGNPNNLSNPQQTGTCIVAAGGAVTAR